MHWDHGITEWELHRFYLSTLCYKLVRQPLPDFPAVGGSVIAHFLCGIFNEVPISVTKKETKDCPVVSNVPGAEISVCLCLLVQYQWVQVTLPPFQGLGVGLCPRVEKIPCAIAQLGLHCSSQLFYVRINTFILDKSCSFQEQSFFLTGCLFMGIAHLIFIPEFLETYTLISPNKVW